MHRTEQIFAVTRIDSSLSANRAIHHRKQRRRNLDMRNPAMINRRDESGDVTDHAATETNYKGLSIQPRGNHLPANCADLIERLRFLASGNCNQYRLKIGRCETSFDSISEEWRDFAICDNCASGTTDKFAYAPSDFIDQSRANEYRMAMCTAVNSDDCYGYGMYGVHWFGCPELAAVLVN